MAPPNAGRTARERARAELTREIKEAARRQLAVSGADGLSLRAVARELGLVSSALYRYFASRDDLLTALIIDAYDAVGAEVEKAATAGTEPRGRWIAACRAVRSWALAHPHEYGLIYGSPVPGYRAPETTIAPAARVPAALVGIVRDAAADGLLAEEPAGTLPEALGSQAAWIAGVLGSGDGNGDRDAGPVVPPALLVRVTIAWTQLAGLVSFELNGQFTNAFDPADALFGYAAERMASFVFGEQSSTSR